MSFAPQARERGARADLEHGAGAALGVLSSQWAPAAVVAMGVAGAVVAICIEG